MCRYLSPDKIIGNTVKYAPSLGGCVHMWASMYDIHEWMLVGSIPHVDSAFVAANIKYGSI